MRLLALREVEGFFHRRRLRPGVLRPHRAILHPRREVGDFLLRELGLGRHLQVLVLVANRLDEQALARLAGDERGARVAALEHGLTRVEQQAALHLLARRAVALETTLGKHGTNALLEELAALIRAGGRDEQAADCDQRCGAKAYQ